MSDAQVTFVFYSHLRCYMFLFQINYFYQVLSNALVTYHAAAVWSLHGSAVYSL